MSEKELNPGKIYADYVNNKMDINTCLNKLKLFLESDQIRDELKRASALRVYDLLVDDRDPKYFEFFEELLISDDSKIVKIEALKFLSKCIEAFNPLKFAFNDETLLESHFMEVYKSILSYFDNLLLLRFEKNFEEKLIKVINKSKSTKESHLNGDLIDLIVSYFVIEFFHKDKIEKFLWINEIYNKVEKDFIRISKIKPDSFGYTIEKGHITGLGLYNCNLTFIPKIINYLSKLKILSITHNQIKEIPDKIGIDCQLDELYLNYNKIEAINRNEKPPPLKITNLENYKSLKKLEMHKSGIEELPETIGELKNLKHLVMSENPELKKLPSSLCKLFNLEILNLRSCSISTIPDQIDNLQLLKFLDLSNNDIGWLPESLKYLENLEDLHLNLNRLNYRNYSPIYRLKEKGVKLHINPSKSGENISL